MCVFKNNILKKWIGFSIAFSSGIRKEALPEENDFNDESENRLTEQGSGLEPTISMSSVSVQVCYQAPDFSGSEELTFTLPSSDDRATQVLQINKEHFQIKVQHRNKCVC